ncbi:MAG: DUF1501 domain-containing protein [Pirellulales bacterium]
MTDSNSEPPGGARNWATGFMPATYQGTKLYAGAEPVLFATKRPTDVSDERQRSKLDFLAKLNARHFAERSSDDAIAARLRSYELAYRMQAAAPEAAGFTRDGRNSGLGGMDNEKTATNGRNCCQARRMIERGVRFVRFWIWAGTKWDAHKDLEGNHSDFVHRRTSLSQDCWPILKAEARPAEGYAGDLGWRVWPDTDERKRRWPRP